MKSLKHIGIIIILLGALVALGIMVPTTSTDGSLYDLLITLGFYVWVSLPFAALIILTSSIHRKVHSTASRVAIFLTSILVVVSSVLIYWASIVNSESSTSALVFIFIPIYGLVATAAFYLLTLFLLRVIMPKHRHRS
jgi:hypothetical protein